MRAPLREARLTRVLERGLADGNIVTVTREWLCRFIDSETGLRVEGAQTRVEVQAPAILAPLAAIEKERQVDGLFPAMLDGAVPIVLAGEGPGDAAMVRPADTAAAIFRSLAADTAGREEPMAFMAELATTAAKVVRRVPRDLFFPAEGQTRDLRELALEDGSKGQIEVRVTASARDSDGLLESSERLIQTRFGGRERISRERWLLAEL